MLAHMCAPVWLRSGHLTYYSQNVGGLGVGRLGEIVAFSSGLSVPIVCLQETRWSDSQAWMHAGYQVIHSGAKNKLLPCGVLIAVGGGLASAELRYDEVIPGRLLRVQVRHPSLAVPLKIINLYQKPFEEHPVSDIREQIWQQLQTAFSYHSASAFSSVPR